MDMDSGLLDVIVAALGGIISVIVVALWKRNSGRLLHALWLAYRKLSLVIPVLRQILVAAAGAAGGSLVFAAFMAYGANYYFDPNDQSAPENEGNKNQPSPDGNTAAPLAVGGEIQFQRGSISINQKNNPSLWNVGAGHCPKWNDGGRRGITDGRVTFEKAFSSPPVVLAAFDVIDTGHGGRPTRLFMDTGNIDKTGFNYNLFTSCNSKVNWVRAHWIAIGNRGKGDDELP